LNPTLISNYKLKNGKFDYIKNTKLVNPPKESKYCLNSVLPLIAFYYPAFFELSRDL